MLRFGVFQGCFHFVLVRSRDHYNNISPAAPSSAAASVSRTPPERGARPSPLRDRSRRSPRAAPPPLPPPSTLTPGSHNSEVRFTRSRPSTKTTPPHRRHPTATVMLLPAASLLALATLTFHAPALVDGHGYLKASRRVVPRRRASRPLESRRAHISHLTPPFLRLSPRARRRRPAPATFTRTTSSPPASVPAVPAAPRASTATTA